MKKEIARVTVLQVILIVYSVLGVAVLLRAFHGSPAPDIFARYVRDWGFLFLFISAGWCVWGFVEMNKPKADHVIGINVLISGLILAGIIAAFAVLATISVASYHSLLVPTGEPKKPSIVNGPQPPD